MPPRTIDAGIAPGQSVSFVWPPGVELTPEAVHATIDTSGAGPTTALLTIRDGSGAVIAKKRQQETIDAGSQGSATWALRLVDNTGGGQPAATQYEAFADSAGVVVPAGTVRDMRFIHAFGAVLLGGFGGVYSVATPGTYALWFALNGFAAGGPYTITAQVRIGTGPTVQIVVITAPTLAGAVFSGGGPTFAITRPLSPVDGIRVQAESTAPGGIVINTYGGLAKLP